MMNTMNGKQCNNCGVMLYKSKLENGSIISGLVFIAFLGLPLLGEDGQFFTSYTVGFFYLLIMLTTLTGSVKPLSKNLGPCQNGGGG